MFILCVEIKNYNKKSLIIKTLKNPFIKKAVSGTANLLRFFPGLKKYLKHNRFVMQYKKYDFLVINHNKSKLFKEDTGLKLTVNIEKLDLDGLLDNIADENFSNNILVRELIKTANICLSENKKLELIQSILTIINDVDLADQMYHTFIENGGKAANHLKGMDLVLGDITLEK